MNSSNLLMQYQSECLEALKSAAKINKPFEKVFMDTLKLFLAIPGKGNFLQIGRYGEFSEQTYTMTELTNHLHGSAGFRTDTRIVTKKAMKSIIASIKTSKDEKDKDEV